MAYPTDPDCLFCKIVAGQIPCHKLLENDHVLAFLDIGPLARGHTLIIPKGHWMELGDVDEDIVGRCGEAAKHLGPVIAQLTGSAGWNLLQNNGKAAGQVVGHVHFHIIPRQEDDGLGYRWNAGEIDHADAQSFAAEVVSGLTS